MARKKRSSKQPAPNWQIFLVIVVSVLMIAGLVWSNQFYTIDKEKPSNTTSSNSGKGLTLTLYSSPNCSCCHNYVEYLENKGYSINFIRSDNYLDYFKDVPQELYSCHIAFGEGYFTVGHIPEEILAKMFSEKPQLDGISLPGMPSGSPGMGGFKTSTFTIYGIANGQSSVYATI